MFLLHFIIKIYYIFLILNAVLCQKLIINDLLKIVSKNDSKIWLDSLKVPDRISNNPYCQICCIAIQTETIGKHCGSHTLCKFGNDRIGAACNGYIKIQFKKVEKETLVDAHNTLRNIVASGLEIRGSPGPQPSSSNMRTVEWNDDLALIAERWAAQCIYSNDVCRDLDRFPVGQIIAQGNLATHNELSFIKMWYDEVVNFNNSLIGNLKLSGRPPTKSYTQLIWADTYQIGCARAVFQESNGYDVVYREHFICNYGPSGNIPNQPVYRIGQPCTACHAGTGCTLEYPALCGTQKEVIISDNSPEEELKQAHAQIEQLLDDLKLRSLSLQKSGIKSVKCSFTIFNIFLSFLVCNFWSIFN